MLNAVVVVVVVVVAVVDDDDECSLILNRVGLSGIDERPPRRVAFESIPFVSDGCGIRLSRLINSPYEITRKTM